ncbi:hypothetical protein RB599_001348 [Gaeumannomyces hyphopodioides]
MVPVRKPGRPLSVCPHPPGRPCACGGITAAIPRAQKCGCGPSDAAPAPEPAPPESPALKGSMSPTRRTFQIQKATKAAARKQSFDLATLERMDPESYNVHSAPPYRTPILPRMPPASDGDKALSPTTPGHSLDYHLAALSGTLDGPTVAASLENGADYPLPQQLDDHLTIPFSAVKHETSRSIAGAATNGSYFEDFGTNANGAEYGADATIDGAGASKPTTPAATPKSCCGGKAPSARVNGNGNPRPPQPTAVTAAHQPLGHFEQHVPATNGGGLTNGAAPLSHPIGVPGAPVMSPFQSPVVQPIFFTHSADPTMYIYPPYYGTYQHPIQPPQWRQVLPPPGGLGYAFPEGHGPAHMSMRALAAPAMGLGTSDDAAARGGFVGMSHQCTCGDACNCLGCPAHPYNEVTQDYVRSAMNIMTEEPTRGEGRDARSATEESKAPVSTAPARAGGGGVCCGGGGGDQTSSAAAIEAVSPTTAQVQQGAGGAGAAEPAASSPPQAQTPSEASAASEDQTHLSASDFLFVTYPFGCEGETASCLCGDDCQCVGCLIHNHPYADG